MRINKPILPGPTGELSKYPKDFGVEFFYAKIKKIYLFWKQNWGKKSFLA